MSDVIKRAAQMIAELAELEATLRLAAAERDVLRVRVAELEAKPIDEAALRRYLLGDGGDDHEEPYLRELPDGNFEKIYPKGWPLPPGPKRPNIIRRRDALSRDYPVSPEHHRAASESAVAGWELRRRREAQSRVVVLDEDALLRPWCEEQPEAMGHGEAGT